MFPEHVPRTLLKQIVSTNFVEIRSGNTSGTFHVLGNGLKLFPKHVPGTFCIFSFRVCSRHILDSVICKCSRNVLGTFCIFGNGLNPFYDFCPFLWFDYLAAALQSAH